MYEFIVDMIVWGDCELTLTILMDLERSTNAKKTIQHDLIMVTFNTDPV
jgi:hypothetical protein